MKIAIIFENKVIILIYIDIIFIVIVFRQPENSEQLAVSSEQLFCFALRQNGLYLDNASIVLLGCLKEISKRYLK